MKKRQRSFWIGSTLKNSILKKSRLIMNQKISTSLFFNPPTLNPKTLTPIPIKTIKVNNFMEAQINIQATIMLLILKISLPITFISEKPTTNLRLHLKVKGLTNSLLLLLLCLIAIKIAIMGIIIRDTN